MLWRRLIVVVACLSLLLPGAAFAASVDPDHTHPSVTAKDDRDEHDDDDHCLRGAKLTSEQKAELDNIYHSMFETHQRLFEKYAEFGVITAKEKDRIVQRHKHFYEKVKKSGYGLCFDADDNEMEYKFFRGKHHRHNHGDDDRDDD